MYQKKKKKNSALYSNGYFGEVSVSGFSKASGINYNI